MNLFIRQSITYVSIFQKLIQGWFDLARLTVVRLTSTNTEASSKWLVSGSWREWASSRDELSTSSQSPKHQLDLQHEPWTQSDHDGRRRPWPRYGWSPSYQCHKRCKKFLLSLPTAHRNPRSIQVYLPQRQTLASLPYSTSNILCPC